MDIASRIAQFENMAQADPNNEMAHFSLGQAYAQADRPADAAQSFLRCVAISPDLSKAYQLAGESLIKAGDHDRAKAVLAQGYIIAAQKGDFIPKTAMSALLKTLGEPLPEVADAPAARPAAAPAQGEMVCRQTGKPGNRLPRPPFKGPVGQWIYDNITRETFDLWIRQGTKVINELRLDLSRDKDQEVYDQHMREFLGIDDAILAQLSAKA
ncbi:MAG: Fe(2+)-trafficking protein [Phycisphaerae bacterium]|nr:Fe(2+)-trafficking protein [Phycisphaerae bacterium]